MPSKRLPGLKEFRLLATARDVERIAPGLYGDVFHHVPLTEYAPTLYAAELLAKAKLRRVRADLEWSVTPC